MKPALLAVLPLTLLAGWQTPPRLLPAGAGVIAGHVIDALTQQPLAGVVLSLSLRDQSFALESRQQQTTTAAGVFRFTNLGASQFSLTADHRSYSSSGYGMKRPGGTIAVLELARDEAVDDLVVSMWPMTEIRGTVVDDRSEPVAGVFIQAIGTGSQPDPDHATGNVSATTDDSGTYRMRVVRPGRYVICAQPRYMSLPILSESNPPRGLQVMAVRPPPRVNAPIGQFASAVPYLIDLDGLSLLEVPTGLTPPPGPDGRLSAFTSTCAPASTTVRDARVVELRPGVSVDRVDIALQLRPAARVSGRLLGQAGPIGDALISLAGLDDVVLPIAAALTDPQGAFTFVIAPAGSRKITARVMNPPIKVTAMPSGMPSVYHPDYGMGDAGGFWFAAPFVIGDRPMSDVVLAALPGTTVTGRLESDRSGPGAAPGVPDASVTLRGADPYGGPRASASSGPFVIKDVRPGSYILNPYAQGWAVASITRAGEDLLGVPFDVGSSGVSGIEIVMTTKSSDVSGVARDAQSRIVRDAAVVIFPVNSAVRAPVQDSNISRVRTTRAINGRYSFTSLPAGDYFVAAMDDAAMGPWPDRAFIASLESRATRVSLGLGEHKTVDLVMSAIEKR